MKTPILMLNSVLQKMKPDWDKLMDAFADSEIALVADVDCTADGKDLCTEHGIRGYVSLLRGNRKQNRSVMGRKSFL